MTKKILLLTSYDPDQVLQILTHRMRAAIIIDRLDIWRPGNTIKLWKGITEAGELTNSQHYADVPVHSVSELKFIYHSGDVAPIITINGKIIDDHKQLAIDTGHRTLLNLYANYPKSITAKLVKWLPEQMNMISFLTKHRIQF